VLFEADDDDHNGGAAGDRNNNNQAQAAAAAAAAASRQKRKALLTKRDDSTDDSDYGYDDEEADDKDNNNNDNTDDNKVLLTAHQPVGIHVERLQQALDQVGYSTTTITTTKTIKRKHTPNNTPKSKQNIQSPQSKFFQKNKEEEEDEEEEEEEENPPNTHSVVLRGAVRRSFFCLVGLSSFVSSLSLICCNDAGCLRGLAGWFVSLPCFGLSLRAIAIIIIIILIIILILIIIIIITELAVTLRWHEILQRARVRIYLVREHVGSPDREGAKSAAGGHAAPQLRRRRARAARVRGRGVRGGNR
jgi:hypothetical protein